MNPRSTKQTFLIGIFFCALCSHASLAACKGIQVPKTENGAVVRDEMDDVVCVDPPATKPTTPNPASDAPKPGTSNPAPDVSKPNNPNDSKNGIEGESPTENKKAEGDSVRTPVIMGAVPSSPAGYIVSRDSNPVTVDPANPAHKQIFSSPGITIPAWESAIPDQTVVAPFQRTLSSEGPSTVSPPQNKLLDGQSAFASPALNQKNQSVQTGKNLSLNAAGQTLLKAQSELQGTTAVTDVSGPLAGSSLFDGINKGFGIRNNEEMKKEAAPQADASKSKPEDESKIIIQNNNTQNNGSAGGGGNDSEFIALNPKGPEVPGSTNGNLSSKENIIHESGQNKIRLPERLDRGTASKTERKPSSDIAENGWKIFTVIGIVLLAFAGYFLFPIWKKRVPDESKASEAEEQNKNLEFRFRPEEVTGATRIHLKPNDVRDPKNSNNEK